MTEEPQELFPRTLEFQQPIRRSQIYAVDMAEKYGLRKSSSRVENSIQPSTSDNNEDEDDEKEMRYREKLTLLIQTICGIVIITFIIGYCVCFIYFVAFKVRLDET